MVIKMEKTKNFKTNFVFATICFFLGFIGCCFNLIINNIDDALIFLLLGISIFNFLILGALIKDFYKKEKQK